MSKTEVQHQQFARAITGGSGVTSALIQAGYSPAQARKGWAIVNKSRGLRLAIAQRARLLIELGGAFTPEEQECLVRGRLIYNVLVGTDKGMASAKALGSERHLSMWQSDAQRGLVIFNSPVELGNKERLLGIDEWEVSTIDDERNRRSESLGLNRALAKT